MLTGMLNRVWTSVGTVPSTPAGGTREGVMVALNFRPICLRLFALNPANVSSALHGGKQERDQHSDDRNHHQ
jgi:hypothetical protein